jgi:hypothetical protein
MHGFAAISARTISAERSVEASSTMMISWSNGSRAATAQSMACSMLSSSLYIGITRETDIGVEDLFMSVPSEAEHLEIEELYGEAASVGPAARLGRNEGDRGPDGDLHLVTWWKRQIHGLPPASRDLQLGRGNAADRDGHPVGGPGHRTRKREGQGRPG